MEEFMEPHPHITLFGPLTLRDGLNQQQLLDMIRRIAAPYDPLLFLIDGWEKKEGMHGSVIAFRIRPSAELRQIAREIGEALSPLVLSQNVWDAIPDTKWFHVTIVNRLDSGMASDIFSRLTVPEVVSSNPPQKPGAIKDIWSRLTGKQNAGSFPHFSPILLDDTGLRITIIKGDGILAEYDLLEKRWISGDNHHNTPSWQKTLARYRHYAGFELTDPGNPHSEDIYLMADLHLGHANIINYCSRPFLFSDTREMDHVLRVPPTPLT